MAAIVEGDTIQAAWFQNIDNTGPFTKTVVFLNDANNINFEENSVNLLRVDTSTGDLKTKGNMEDNADI